MDISFKQFLPLKYNKDTMVFVKAVGVIPIRPLESGINSYNIYITGFWFM